MWRRCKNILIRNVILIMTWIRMVLSTEEVQEIFQVMKLSRKVKKGTKMMMRKVMTLNRDDLILISILQKEQGSPI
jgi:hypothetical protein